MKWTHNAQNLRDRRKELGYIVLRFQNSEAESDIEKVLDKIKSYLV